MEKETKIKIEPVLDFNEQMKLLMGDIINVLEIEDNSKNKKRRCHMMNAAFIAKRIAEDLKLKESDKKVVIVSTLFHDIFKLTSMSNAKLHKMDICNDDLRSHSGAIKGKNKDLFDMHVPMGATLIKTILDMPVSISLNKIEKRKIYNAISKHSDKFDKEYTKKTVVERVVLESDILEKIGISIISAVVTEPSTHKLEKLKEYYNNNIDLESAIRTAPGKRIYTERMRVMKTFIDNFEANGYY